MLFTHLGILSAVSESFAIREKLPSGTMQHPQCIQGDNDVHLKLLFKVFSMVPSLNPRSCSIGDDTGIH